MLSGMVDVTLDRIFVDYSVKKLRQLAARIDDCLGRLTDHQVWIRGSDTENAIGNLVLHLCGNVSQWILCGVGGEPDSRDRDREFQAKEGAGPEELAARLQSVIEKATAVLAHVTPERLAQPVTIQGYDVTVMECIYHVVEHFSGHTGQIIFATKALTGSDLGFYAHLRTTPSGHGGKTP
jgi:uncharacterized damage-inducible protein DinB